MVEELDSKTLKGLTGPENRSKKFRYNYIWFEPLWWWWWWWRRWQWWWWSRGYLLLFCCHHLTIVLMIKCLFIYFFFLLVEMMTFCWWWTLINKKKKKRKGKGGWIIENQLFITGKMIFEKNSVESVLRLIVGLIFCYCAFTGNLRCV